MGKSFLEKPCTRVDGETMPRTTPKKSNLGVSLYQESKVLYSLFLLQVKLRTYGIGIDISSLTAKKDLLLQKLKLIS